MVAASSQLQPGQPGSNGGKEGARGHHRVPARCRRRSGAPGRQVACLDGAPLARGDSGVTESPGTSFDGAGREGSKRGPRAAGILSASGLERAVVCALVGRRASWESGENQHSPATGPACARPTETAGGQREGEIESPEWHWWRGGRRGSETQCGAEGGERQWGWG